MHDLCAAFIGNMVSNPRFELGFPFNYLIFHDERATTLPRTAMELR